MKEYRCKACPALLFRADGEHGRCEIVCRKCGTKQTIYLGGYRKSKARLTVVSA